MGTLGGTRTRTNPGRSMSSRQNGDKISGNFGLKRERRSPRQGHSGGPEGGHEAETAGWGPHDRPEPMALEPGSRPRPLIHHWIGTVVLPNVSLDRVVAVMQDYDRYGDIYAPHVRESALLEQEGNRFRVYAQLYEKKILTFVADSEYEAEFLAVEVVREGPELGHDHGIDEAEPHEVGDAVGDPRLSQRAKADDGGAEDCRAKRVLQGSL